MVRDLQMVIAFYMQIVQLHWHIVQLDDTSVLTNHLEDVPEESLFFFQLIKNISTWSVLDAAGILT